MTSAHLKREISGIALLVFAAFLGAALVVLGLGQLRAGVDVQQNVGPIGYYLAYPLVWLVGWPAALMAPLAPAVHALKVFGRLQSETDRKWMTFFAGVVALVPIGVALAVHPPLGSTSVAAGMWGSFVGYYFTHWFGGLGAWLVWVLATSALTAATLAWNPIRMLVGPGVAAVRDKDARPLAVTSRPEPARAASTGLAVDGEPEVVDVDDAASVADAGGESAAPKRVRKRKPRTESTAPTAVAVSAGSALPADELPAIELLTEAPPRYGDTGKQALDDMETKLLDTLRTFRIEGRIAGRTTGPVVTQFEFEPAPGVKVRQVSNLANDLALAMRAASIRIVAPIPGKGAVGVEVPNPNAETVSLRELLESHEFQHSRAALPVAIGKNLQGKPVIEDLAKMPHLLVAGATGAGKSVCINTIITSLLYKSTEKRLRLLMVDPKMVELSVYNKLPHLRHKVVTDNRDAAAVLKWAVMEMQERYELLAANACRNITDFNRRVQDGAAMKMPKQKDVAFEELAYKGGILPYIVIVIDEMADLMMTVQSEVETPIAMLAQKARAIGIHMILATQRPSVNVITGLIKANFPSRIGFRVASQVDSRTILDGAGAESLLGNGDMLFIPPGKSEPARVQGAFISSDDTDTLMKWYEDQRARRRAVLAAQGLVLEEPSQAEDDIIAKVRAREAEEAGQAEADQSEAGDRDKLFREAAEVVIQHQQGSTSLLQRRLKVGYGRAARIIDQLHSAGVLGPPDGSKPRDVLIGLADLDRVCGPRV